MTSRDETRIQILRLLRDGAERYGRQLVEESKGEVAYLGLYTNLYMLEELQLVSSRPEPDPAVVGAPRSLYRITARGIEVLKRQPARAVGV